MNIVLLGISKIDSINDNSIYADLMREFVKNGHNVSIYCGTKIDSNTPYIIKNEANSTICKVNVGRVQKVNPIIKGLNFLTLDSKMLKAIRKTYSYDTLDLLLYMTPPITLTKTIASLKKRYGCKTYLLLKDIFPQNSLDLGMLSKHGLKGFIYRYFRRIEVKLLKLSDHIGCMSQANVDYIIKHNPYLDKNLIEVNPNSIDTSRLDIVERDSVADIKNKYQIPLDKRIFIYGGNLGKPQGIPFVLKCIKACECLDNAYFVIVGNGTDYHLVEEYVTNNKPKNLTVINHLPNNDYCSLVSACDVGLIFLDHRFTIPNYPSRLIDYMRVGLPIYACTDSNSDVGQTIVEGGFGWRSPSNDVDQFVKNIMDISNSELKDVSAIERQYLIDHFSTAGSYQIIMNHLK